MAHLQGKAASLLLVAAVLQELGPVLPAILVLVKGSKTPVFSCEISRCLHIGNFFRIQNKTKQLV